MLDVPNGDWLSNVLDILAISRVNSSDMGGNGIGSGLLFEPEDGGDTSELNGKTVPVSWTAMTEVDIEIYTATREAYHLEDIFYKE